ncbi:MAG: hypothetical protein ABIT01_19585 [Thermoanaerobaculia bacterium]
MTAPVLAFKTPRQAAEWGSGKVLPLAREILLDGAAFAIAAYAWSFTLTDIYRTPAEDAALKGHFVHPLWRAVDVRTRDRDPGEISGLAAYINGRWIYDHERPRMLCCFTEPHGDGPHAHFQVHSHTKRR